MDIRSMEFYNTPEGDVMIRKQGECEHALSAKDREFIAAFISILSEFYPEAYKALCDTYKKSIVNRDYYQFLIVKRFIRCNFGAFDNVQDVDASGAFKFEFVSCPLKGECKHDGIICSPKFNSTLSARELEVMRLAYEGRSDEGIADSLYIALNTVNNHRKNAFRKLDVHSMPEFMRYAERHNLFKN